jgi:predicted GIY-YIG superfamily endonuclease
MARVSAEILDAMVASGCSAEQIAAVVKAALIDDPATGEPRRHYVYVLSDPRDEYRSFYVGVSQDPAQRLRSHARDPLSAAYITLRQIADDGYEIIDTISIDAVFDKRADALQHESKLINEIHGLVNRAGRRVELS